MPEVETEHHPDQNALAQEISERANSASEKVRQRVNEIIIPNINKLDSFASRWLMDLQNDFYTLVEDPNDKCGNGNYKGWTADEIKELYSVLYDEEID
jgi:hypothetical protein